MSAYVTRKKKNYMFGLEHSENIFFSSNGYKGQNTFLYCILKMSFILRVLSDLSYPMSKICFEKGSSFEGASVVRVFHCFWVANNVHLISRLEASKKLLKPLWTVSVCGPEDSADPEELLCVTGELQQEDSADVSLAPHHHLGKQARCRCIQVKHWAQKQHNSTKSRYMC